jgi:hypothetical protein
MEATPPATVYSFPDALFKRLVKQVDVVDDSDNWTDPAFLKRVCGALTDSFYAKRSAPGGTSLGGGNALSSQPLILSRYTQLIAMAENRLCKAYIENVKLRRHKDSQIDKPRYVLLAQNTAESLLKYLYKKESREKTAGKVRYVPESLEQSAWETTITAKIETNMDPEKFFDWPYFERACKLSQETLKLAYTRYNNLIATVIQLSLHEYNDVILHWESKITRAISPFVARFETALTGLVTPRIRREYVDFLRLPEGSELNPDQRAGFDVFKYLKAVDYIYSECVRVLSVVKKLEKESQGHVDSFEAPYYDEPPPVDEAAARFREKKPILIEVGGSRQSLQRVIKTTLVARYREELDASGDSSSNSYLAVKDYWRQSAAMLFVNAIHTYLFNPLTKLREGRSFTQQKTMTDGRALEFIVIPWLATRGRYNFGPIVSAEGRIRSSEAEWKMIMRNVGISMGDLPREQMALLVQSNNRVVRELEEERRGLTSVAPSDDPEVYEPNAPTPSAVRYAEKVAKGSAKKSAARRPRERDESVDL